MRIPAETTNDTNSIKSIVSELNQVLDANLISVRFVKDLILNLAIELEHLGTPSGSISTRIKRILQEKITQGKITARWIHNSLPSRYKRAYRTKREVTSLSTIPNNVINAAGITEKSVRGNHHGITEYRVRLRLIPLTNAFNLLTMMGEQHVWFKIQLDNATCDLLCFEPVEGEGTYATQDSKAQAASINSK
jgi:hypothetical protein